MWYIQPLDKSIRRAALRMAQKVPRQRRRIPSKRYIDSYLPSHVKSRELTKVAVRPPCSLQAAFE